MSANRDRDLKTTFVFNNLYEIYKRGQQVDRTGLKSGQVIKAEDVNSNMMGLVTVRKFQPASFIGKQIETAQASAAAKVAITGGISGAPRIAAPVLSPAQLPEAKAPAPRAAMPNPVLDSLKKNLSDLNELHGRLRFMLTELEDLVRDKK